MSVALPKIKVNQVIYIPMVDTIITTGNVLNLPEVRFSGQHEMTEGGSQSEGGISVNRQEVLRLRKN